MTRNILWWFVATCLFIILVTGIMAGVERKNNVTLERDARKIEQCVKMGGSPQILFRNDDAVSPYLKLCVLP